MSQCFIKSADPSQVYVASEVKAELASLGIDFSDLRWVRTMRNMQADRVMLYAWCDENCSGRFVAMSYYHWGFENDADELMFKLAWGGERI